MLASDAKKAFRMENSTSTKPESEKLVIVTGFGPFEGHEDVNASWEAVKLLPDKLELNEQNYKLEKQQVSVEYEAVNKAVEEIWQRKPELVIHCGVHGKANCIHVERLAFNHKFKRPDYKGKFLRNGSACLENCGDGKQHSSDDVLHTALNVDSIIAKISKTYTCTTDDINKGDTFEKTDATIAKCSSDVGDYLCGYIYLKSLDINNERSLFVHVPPIDKPFSSEDTADVILNITKECLRQLQESIKV